MKAILCLLLSALCALAQTPQPVHPKRPLGVPADAKPFNWRWYKVYLEKKSWHAARDKCKELGGQLVTVPDAATWEFVKTLTPASVWMGATDEKSEGVWEWADGSAIIFTSWYPGQPDNAAGQEHYIAMWQAKWNDVPRSGAFGNNQVVGFICEWKSPSQPAAKDQRPVEKTK